MTGILAALTPSRSDVFMTKADMIEADLLLSGRWLLPVAPASTVIEDGAVAIAAGRIVAVGSRRDLLSTVRARQQQHLADHVLLPGLVNAHNHAAMTLLRGCGEDMALMDWLNNRIWPLEKALVTPEFVADGVELACAEQIRGGVTAFTDNYFYAERAASVVQKAGLRGLMASPILSFPMPGAPDGKAGIHRVLELHDICHNLPLVKAAFGPHAPYTVDDALLIQVATYAEELGLIVHMHVHESAQEIADSIKQYSMRPLERLNKLGLLGPQFVAVHAVHLNDGDIALLKENGVQTVHCPESNLKLASGFSPVAKLQAAGINVGLGTDGAASNNDLDLLGELRTATLLGKAVAGDPTAMNAERMLYMATLGGARTMGLESEIGSLEVGKSADLIAVDLSGLLQQPVYNPLYSLLYTVQREQVSDVWVAGQALMRNRELLTIDESALREKVQRWQSDVQSTLALQK